MASVVSNAFKQDMLGANAINLGAGGNTVKVALFTSSYTPAATDLVYGSGNLASNEVSSSGTGYTTGGISLPAANNSILTADAPTIGWTNTSGTSSIQWTSSSFTARYAVVYNSTVSNRVICIIDFGADKTVTSGTFTITWNAAGIITLT
jgi:hypothetical protein